MNQLKKTVSLLLICAMLFILPQTCYAIPSGFQYLGFCDEGKIYYHYNNLRLWTDSQNGPTLQGAILIELTPAGISVYRNLIGLPLNELGYMGTIFTFNLNAKTYTTTEIGLFNITEMKILYKLPGYPDPQQVIPDSFEHNIAKMLFAKAREKYQINP